MRRTSFCFAVLLLLAGCGQVSVAPPGPDTATPPALATSEAPSPHASAGGPGGGSRGGGGSHPSPTSYSYPGAYPSGGGYYFSPPASNPDRGTVGAMARNYLHPAPYSQISLEIDVAGNASPTPSEVNTLRSTIKSATGKAPSMAGSRSFNAQSSGGCWSQQDLHDISRGRNVSTGGSTASMLFIFLDGSFCDSSSVLGAAFEAGSVVIFTDQVGNLATPTVPRSVFMQAVTTHELGHLLGLVNIGYHSVHPHEDAQHPHHSSNTKSVMYWAIDSSNLIQQFVTGPPTTYDSDDTDDLAKLADGTY